MLRKLVTGIGWLTIIFGAFYGGAQATDHFFVTDSDVQAEIVSAEKKTSTDGFETSTSIP
jgi:hypothetical protein